MNSKKWSETRNAKEMDGPSLSPSLYMAVYVGVATATTAMRVAATTAVCVAAATAMCVGSVATATAVRVAATAVRVAATTMRVAATTMRTAAISVGACKMEDMEAP